MADVASQPRPIANAGLTVSPPNSLGIPIPARSFSGNNKLTLDTFSPVTQNGSFEFDRIIKAGEVWKRTRKTKQWKPIYIVLRPNLLSLYRDAHETKLRHQIKLSELTAVARQKDPKRKDKQGVFGLFSPSRNYHLEASSAAEAQEWVDLIRREARFEEVEGEMVLASPGGAGEAEYRGFERSIDAHISPNSGADDRAGGVSGGGYASSSDAGEALSPIYALPKVRDKTNTANNTTPFPRHASYASTYADYSGADVASVSDFSDIASASHINTSNTARLSALSLAQTTDPGRPSTSSGHPPPLHTLYGGERPGRPSIGARNVSQMSGFGLSADDIRRAQQTEDLERVVYHGWLYLLKSKSGMRQWKRVWLVLRAKGLALYKNEDEYAALLVLPLDQVIDAVEIDPISRSKRFCLQIISEERNYRFCALTEEGLTRCLGAFKSLLVKRNARLKEKEKEGAPVATPAPVGPP